MTETTKTIFEKYEVRKSKKQKSAFIDYVDTVSRECGYEARVEKGYLGSRNIVVGDPQSAKVVYTAHYDTCAVLPMPNFITPKNIFIYILYQILLVFVIMLLPVFLVSFLSALLLTLVGVNSDIAAMIAMLLGYATLILSIVLMMVGPANKHTANDNTSGVTLLLDIMRALPAESKKSAAFIFFDLEEAGLFGSAGYASKHKSEMKDKLLINFDCVSDGENMIFVLKKGAQKYKNAIAEAFPDSDDVHAQHLTSGVVYPSDQANFPCGVGVAALKRSKRLGILYMNRIHTRRDTVYREENIAYLTSGAVRLSESFSELCEKN